MTSSGPSPKLPIWVFAVTDLVLVAAGVLVATQSGRPLSPTAIIAVTACTLAGAVVLLVPMLVGYERQKNEALDDRQRALEALARTVSESADQISIAAGGLRDTAELAQKQVKLADQLPQKLQEKIAEFQSQLANANETDREELEKELEELRGHETERLQTVADRIAKTVAELSKVESASRQHLTAAQEAVSKLSFGTAGAIGRAQAAAEQAFSLGRQEALRAIGESAAGAAKTIETARTEALAALHEKIDSGVARVADALGRIEALLERSQTAVPASGRPAAAADSRPAPALDRSAEPVVEEPVSLPGSPEDAPPVPKRNRKPRHEDPAEPGPTSPHVAERAEAAAALDGANSSRSTEARSEEPKPVSSQGITEVAPVAPATAEPFATATPPEGAADAPKPPRKRGPRKAEGEPLELGAELGLAPVEGDQSTGTGVVERVLTSDGATRLIVTAYIGIGNRLFIRGDGPGLSWEKGVPLQFVSIGKWRWETSDVSSPIQFKLLKNDEQECMDLGALTIDPGHQHEITANFG